MSRLLKLSSWSRTGVTQSGSAGAADAPGAARMTPAPLAVRTRAPRAAPTRRIIKRSPRVALGDRLARQVDGRPHVADGPGDMDHMLGVRKRQARVGVVAWLRKPRRSKRVQTGAAPWYPDLGMIELSLSAA